MKGLKSILIKKNATERIKIPSNAKQLTRFLGMVTYVARFIPNLATKENIQWCSTDIHGKDF